VYYTGMDFTCLLLLPVGRLRPAVSEAYASNFIPAQTDTETKV